MKYGFQILIALSAATTALGQAQYDFVRLTGVNSVGFSIVLDISENGTVAGGVQTPSGMRPALWSESTGLQVLPQFDQPSVATGVNDAGQVAGSFLSPNGGGNRAFLLDNGVITTFEPSIATQEVTAGVGITDAGRILVSSGFQDDEPDGKLIAISFLADANGTDPNIFVSPSSISGGGFIAGFDELATPNGTEISLPTPGGIGSARALSVNDAGIAAGAQVISSSGFSSDLFPFYWDENQQPVALPVANSFENSTGIGINNSNEIVGRADNAAFLFRIDDGSTLDLASVTASVPANLRLREATRINDAGQILGTFDDGGFFNEGTFLLNPVDGGNGDGVGTPFCMAGANSVGTGAVLTGLGSASVAANDLQLRVEQAPDQFGVFFFSSNQQANPVPFGDGFLCVAQPITRINPVVPVQGGTAELNLDLPSLGFLAGQTRFFQFWFRDPAFGGAGFNTTQGLEITFQN